MASKTLKSRIDALWNALGRGVEDRPGLDKIRGQLASFSLIAEALENGEATREAEAEIRALEAALEKSNTELAKLKDQMQAANAEIKKFQAEQKKREEKDRQIDPKQFEILARLPTENQGGLMTFREIIQDAAISFEEAEVRLDRLRKDGLVIRGETFTGHIAWQRTIEGTKLVLARRLAGEEEQQPQQPQRKHPNRTETEEDIIRALAYVGDMSSADFPDNTDLSRDRAEVALYDLEKDGLLKIVERAEKEKAARYSLSIEGVRYMLERGYLP